jgi:uncharacterized protein (TIGR02302 family)
MSDIDPFVPLREPPSRPRLRIALAGAVLLWERLWRAVWAPVSITGAYLAAALFGLPQSLSGGSHAGLLTLTALAFLAALWRGARGFRFPGPLEARRRLERDAGVPHRPLNTLDDRPSGDDPLAAALWRLHQERVRAALGRLGVGLPRPNVVERDPYALRVLVGLVLAVAAAGSWGEWPRRVGAAFSPRIATLAPAPPPTLDAWLTPPDYTGLPTVFLQTGARAAVSAGDRPQPVSVPRGSVLMARLSGGLEAPRLDANGTDLPFDTVEPGTYQVQRKIDSGTRLAVVRTGEVLAQWPIVLVPDQPPEVAFADEPAAAANGALRFGFSASDDYGLAGLSLMLRREGGDSEETVELPLPGNRPKDVTQTSVQDLTSHPWAGLPVTMALAATDGAGQTARGAALRIVLPERRFNHPVARAVIEVRKGLLRSGDGERAVGARRLLDIGARPEAFASDTVAVLALRSAASRLLLDDDAVAVPEVAGLLWDTALRIEDGTLSIAERGLRDAQERLRQALDRDAGDEEIARLMDELQQAIDQYMEAMEKQLRQSLERGESLPDLPPELADRLGAVDPGDVQSMLERMKSLAETGSRDAARQMLSQLQRMLENMRVGTMTPDQRGRQDETWNQLRDLKDLAQRQQQLLDEAFQLSQQGDTGGRGRNGVPSPTMQAQAERQERLRRDLADLMKRLGESGTEPPTSLGRAERAMRGAVQALKRGQPGNAVPRETQSVDELQQGIRAFSEAAIQRMMEMGAMPGGMPSPGGMRGMGRDPLGRRSSGSGPIDGGDVRIPEEGDLQKAREILEELRRRSGEFSRPKNERDYIDRLLRRF